MASGFLRICPAQGAFGGEGGIRARKTERMGRMQYFEIKVFTSQMGLDVVGGILDDLGVAGFIIEDPETVKELLRKENEYDWDYVDESVLELENAEASLTFYLEPTQEDKVRLESFKDQLNALRSSDREKRLGRLVIAVTEVCDADWKDNWKAYFKPSHISERIVVKPSWEDYEKQSAEELVIEIDPGMAFGTGTHPTTTLCVRLLEKYIQSPDEVVLDVGCGSGILSMAAALLGIRKIKGVEIDPVAVDVAKENVALNHLSGQIEVLQGDLTKGLDFKADIVVANLMADLVMMLSKDVSRHLQGRKIYISSGILIEKQKQVAEAIVSAGFEILEIAEEGEWCAIAARGGC